MVSCFTAGICLFTKLETSVCRGHQLLRKPRSSSLLVAGRNVPTHLQDAASGHRIMRRCHQFMRLNEGACPMPNTTNIKPFTRTSIWVQTLCRPGVELRANPKSISHRCHLFEVALVWELAEETIHLPLGCLQGCVGTWRALRRVSRS